MKVLSFIMIMVGLIMLLFIVTIPPIPDNSLIIIMLSGVMIIMMGEDIADMERQDTFETMEDEWRHMKRVWKRRTIIVMLFITLLFFWFN